MLFLRPFQQLSLVFFIFLFLVSIQPAKASTPAQTRQAIATLDQAIDEILNKNVQPGCPSERTKPPGIALALKFGKDEAVQLYEAGSLDPECDKEERRDQPVKMDPKKLVEIGSVSKMVTAAALLRLKQENHRDFDLDQNVYYFLGGIAEFHGVHPTATVRHLMNQTAGTGRFPSSISSATPRTGLSHLALGAQNGESGDFGYSPVKDPPPECNDEGKGLKFWTTTEVLTKLQNPYHAVAGTEFAYSNGNWLFLDLIWKLMANSHDFDESMELLFREPQGLNDLYYPSHKMFDTERLAVGWHGNKRVRPDCRMAYYSGYGVSGGMVASPEDITTFMYNLLATDRVLNKRSQEIMQQWVDVDNTNLPGAEFLTWEQYGLGLIRYRLEMPLMVSFDLIGHGGATAYFVCNVLSIPELDVAMGLFFNHGQEDVIMDRLMSLTRDIALILWFNRSGLAS